MVFPCPTISIDNARIGNVESSHMYSGAGDEANDVTTYSLTWSYGTVQLVTYVIHDETRNGLKIVYELMLVYTVCVIIDTHNIGY